MNRYLPIVTININELNAPVKRHRVAEWIRKHDWNICCLPETHLKTQTENEAMGKNIPSIRT